MTTAPGPWWLLPTDVAAPGRRRHVDHLERCFGELGPHPPRFCPNHNPEANLNIQVTEQPCRACRECARRFDAWVRSQ
jgi:hypothetical protein